MSTTKTAAFMGQSTIVASRIEGERLKPIAILQSDPDSITLHRITDGDLDVLSMSDQSWQFGISTMLLGAGFGFFQNLVVTLYWLYSADAAAPSGINVFFSLFCVALLGVGGSLLWAARRDIGKSGRLVGEIRARSRNPSA